MSEKATVLVTGVAGYWGARVATRLGREAGLHVIGIDREPPVKEIEGLDFIKADVRNPLLIELLKQEGILNLRMGSEGAFVLSQEDVGTFLDEVDAILVVDVDDVEVLLEEVGTDDPAAVAEPGRHPLAL